MHLISILIFLLSFIYKTEAQDVSGVIGTVIPINPAQPELQALPIIPVEPEVLGVPVIPINPAQPELQALPIIPVEPEVQGVPVPINSAQPELQPELQEISVIPIQPELQQITTLPLQPELQQILPIQPEPELSKVILPIEPELSTIPTLPILPIEPEPAANLNPEPDNDHSTPESIASADIIRRNGDAIINYLNNKFINIISIETEIRVMLLADFITVYSDLNFGPNITNQSIDDYCNEFRYQLEILSNRTFDSCTVPDGTVYKPGNVVTMTTQSIPSTASGAIGLFCSLLIIASSVFILL